MASFKHTPAARDLRLFAVRVFSWHVRGRECQASHLPRAPGTYALLNQLVSCLVETGKGHVGAAK